jgi:hypothetical protein
VVAYDSGGLNPFSIALADVNRDGKTDLVIANTFNSFLGVMLGNGNGTFQAVVTYSSGANTSPRKVVIADLNGDAKLDLVFADIQGVGSIGALFGNGDGTFRAVTVFSSNPRHTSDYVAVGDMNGDGNADLVSAPNFNAPGSGDVQVLLGNGNGTFQTARLYNGGSSNSLALADVNGDGRLDVLTAKLYENSAGVLLGNGDGSLQAEQTYSTGPNSAPYEVAVADVNADGRPDLLTANYGTSTAGVLLGNGDGTFQPMVTYNTGSNSTPAGITAADINADGHLDLVTANFGTEAVAVLLGTGNGTFQAPISFTTDSSPGELSAPMNVVAADINQDGRLDLLTANFNVSTAGVLLQNTVLATRTALPGASVSLAPNPASAHSTLRLAGLPPTVVTLQATLLDATGRVVGHYTLPVSNGALQAELPTAALAPGLYVVHLLALEKGGAAAGTLPVQRLSVR